MVFIDLQNATLFNNIDLLGRLLLIGIFALIAYLVHRSAHRLAHTMAGGSRVNRRGRRLVPEVREERRQTIESIFAGIISLTAVVTAILATLGLFVSLDNLIWMIGLFSAAFGLGARPFISDVLTGIAIIFDNTFNVGEKVLFTDINVEGVVEEVGVRTTHVRAPTGELFIIPNGDVRTVRNFSRGLFSQVRISLIVPTNKMDQALNELEQIREEAMLELPNLIEPWLILSEDDLGQTAKLVIIAKARHGRGAEMKPRLEAFVQERLARVDIQLGG